MFFLFRWKLFESLHATFGPKLSKLSGSVEDAVFNSRSAGGGAVIRPPPSGFIRGYRKNGHCLAEMQQTVISYVCLEGQWYGTVFDPVGLVVSRIEGVAILPTLAPLPHSPLLQRVSRYLGEVNPHV